MPDTEGTNDTMPGRYSYSLDDERYDGQFETRDEAESEGRYWAENDGRARFYTARCKWQEAGDYVVNGSSLIEWMLDNAYETAGEAVENWEMPEDESDPAVADLTRRLRELVNAWATEHGMHPGFWVAADVQEHRVEASGE